MKLNNIYISSLLYLLLTGCSFYSIKGSIPSHLSRVVINPIVNESSEYTIGQKFEDQFMQSFIEENLLLISDLENADCKLEFKIINLSDKPYTLNETSFNTIVEQWEISITIQVIWFDFIDQKNILNKDIRESIIYNLDNSSIVNESLNNNVTEKVSIISSRDEAIEKCIINLSERVITELTSTW